MTFAELTRAQAQLRNQALQKEAVVGKIIGAPFKAMGWGLGKALKGTGRAAAAPVRGGLRAGWKNVKARHPVAAPLMMGAGLVGIGAAGVSAVGKGRQYNRGFDPRIQDASMQRVR